MAISSSYSVLKQVLDYIRLQDLSAGDKLPSYRQLADALQIDRHTIRDALVQAEAMGLVRVYPRAGAFIRSPTRAPFIDFFRLSDRGADSIAQDPA